MWQPVKCVGVLGLAIALSACASTFSSYDSNFSCKNTDHGGCEHPMVAYKIATAEGSVDHSTTSQNAANQANDDTLTGEADVGGFGGYRNALYGELETLIRKPATPILKPAKTVRTLVLPYTDPSAKDQRLYMPRYIFSVVEDARFVLAGPEVSQKGAPFLQGLISSTAPQNTKPMANEE